MMAPSLTSQLAQRFQSYLYGIEILEQCKHFITLRRFQSYLYGIEITANLKGDKGRKSFNRTFMELKWKILPDKQI